MSVPFAVPDASVVIKFFIPEVFSEQALQLLELVQEGEIELVAPHLLYCETGNILWKKNRKGEITLAETNEILVKILALPIERIPDGDVAQMAFQIASEWVPSATVYDAIYLATALSQRATFVTADSKLAKKVFREHSDLREHCMPIREYLDRISEYEG